MRTLLIVLVLALLGAGLWIGRPVEQRPAPPGKYFEFEAIDGSVVKVPMDPPEAPRN